MTHPVVSPDRIPEKWVEKVAPAMCPPDMRAVCLPQDGFPCTDCYREARSAISTLAPLIAERCAEIAEGVNEYPKDEPLIDKLSLFRAGRSRAAAAIRSTFPPGEGAG
jgi:hypothetical protein